MQVKDAMGNIVKDQMAPTYARCSSSTSRSIRSYRNSPATATGGDWAAGDWCRPTAERTGAQPVLGDGFQLLYISGQGIQQALNLNLDHTVTFDAPVLTQPGGNKPDANLTPTHGHLGCPPR